MIFLEARGSKDGYAWAHEMEHAEAADELREDRQDRPELASARARPFQKNALFRLGDCLLDVLGGPVVRRLRAHDLRLSRPGPGTEDQGRRTQEVYEPKLPIPTSSESF